MDIIRYEMDGETVGIIVKNKNTKKYITGKDRNIRVFNNLDVAVYSAPVIIKDSDPSDFEYFVKINKDIVVSIQYCQRVDNTWQFFVDHKLYVVTEKRLNKTNYMGYIAFENGQETHCDKEYGFKRQKELFNMLRDEFTGLVLEKNSMVRKIHRIGGKEYVLHLKGTTEKIHIMCLSKLMDTNQKRREENKLCFKFIKDMDKFLSFYIYCDKDISETSKLEGEAKAQRIIDYIIQDMKYFYPELNTVSIPVTNANPIEIEDRR